MKKLINRVHTTDVFVAMVSWYSHISISRYYLEKYKVEFDQHSNNDMIFLRSLESP